MVTLKRALLSASSGQILVPKRGTIITNATLIDKTGTSTAIGVQRRLNCLPIDEKDILGVPDSVPHYITRYIPKDYYNDAVNGYIRFSTTAIYRSKENNKIKRLSDGREGIIIENFKSYDGLYRLFEVDDTIYVNLKTENFKNDIAVEVLVNDFCFCASKGKFKKSQIKSFIRHKNKDITHFVTYNVKKLYDELLKYFSQSRLQIKIIPLIRCVRYGGKSKKYFIGETYKYNKIYKEMQDLWLSATFMKPLDFQYENEVRIVLVNPLAPGGLWFKSDPIVIKLNNINDFIYDFGEIK